MLDGKGSHRQRVQSYYRELAPLLPFELADRGDEAFWRDRVQSSSAETIFELGCGSGRITRILAPLVGRIVAVDLSGEMLQIAREELADRENVELLQADIRALSLGERFDFIVAADDPFSHMLREESRERAFQAASRHLAPEGRFVADIFWLPRSRRKEASSGKGIEKSRSVETHRGRLRIQEWRKCHLDEKRFEATYSYWLDHEPIRKVEFTGHLWTWEEMESLLLRVGLEAVVIWGDYDFQQWNRDRSPRMILECKRKD